MSTPCLTRPAIKRLRAHALFCALLPGVAAAVVGCAAPAAQASTSGSVSAAASSPGPGSEALVRVQASGHAEVLHVTVGRSLVLTTGSALRRVYVGDPKILAPYSAGTNEEVITAKSFGVTSLMLWDEHGGRRSYTVFADVDTEGLTRVLENAVPGAELTVATRGDRIFLAGTVPTDAGADAIFKLVSTYSKNIVDGIKVAPVPVPQVELKLRIVEVDRSRLEQFGVNFFAFGSSTLGSTSTQQFATSVVPLSTSSSTALTVSDPLNLLLFSAKLNAGVTVKDLEQKQVLQVLAEPTLTTLSGVAARFLSGGEFPMPIVQGGSGSSTAITIVFKPYGVKVDFTPTVNADGSIRLNVAPEVSALDYGNGVTISGFAIPALSTRRAETEVELADGQSFVLSGLLDHRTSDNLSRTPGIASVPILGEIFRSKGIQHSVVELVVLVTATIVDPLHAAAAEAAATPKMAIPNLDRDTFDRQFPHSAQDHADKKEKP